MNPRVMSKNLQITYALSNLMLLIPPRTVCMAARRNSLHFKMNTEFAQDHMDKPEAYWKYVLRIDKCKIEICNI